MSVELGGGEDTVMGIEGGRKEVVEAEGGEGGSINEETAVIVGQEMG